MAGAWLAKAGTQQPNPGRFRACLEHAVRVRTGGSLTALAQEVGVAAGTLRSWRTGRSQPRFDYALHFCLRAGINATDAWFGKGAVSVGAGVPVENHLKRPPGWRGLDHEVIAKKLRELVFRKKGTMSGEQISRALGVSVSTLRRRHGEVFGFLVEAHARALNKRGAETLRAQKKRIYETVYALRAEGFKASEAQVFCLENGFSRAHARKPALKAAWHHALEKASGIRQLG